MLVPVGLPGPQNPSGAFEIQTSARTGGVQSPILSLETLALLNPLLSYWERDEVGFRMTNSWSEVQMVCSHITWAGNFYLLADGW